MWLEQRHGVVVGQGMGTYRYIKSLPQTSAYRIYLCICQKFSMIGFFVNIWISHCLAKSLTHR